MVTQQNIVEPVDLTDSAETDDTLVALPIEDLLRQVTDVFPDICPVHLDKLAEEKFHVPESIIEAILSDLENGVSYPKRPVLGKRKRQSDPILEILAKADDEFGESDVLRLNEYFMGPSWKEQISKIKSYRTKCVNYLKSRVFRSVPKTRIKKIFDRHRDASLFQLYWLMGEAGFGEEAAGWENAHRNFQPIDFENADAETSSDSDPVSLCKELYAARRIAAFKGRAVLNGREEAANREKAEAGGTLRDCGCCFSDEPMNRMVSCDANPEHLFCYACSQKHAETQLGLSKYELNCLSMDDCPGSFLATERKSYLDGKTISALDRLEQDAALREANIENLASCPFCPYAAECPPAEEDKEFRCQNPDCRVVSCRLCNRETHIPKTCAEAAADNKDSARHQIEEAMSAAMIRKCNKCSTPFVKLSGCNKMTCTKPGCGNRQCYICGKSCDYDHFTRSGCPLHDSVGNEVEARHRKEAETAQEAARKRLLEENPDMTEEELRVKLPDDVNTGKKKPAKPRAPRAPRRRNGAPANPVPPPPLPQGEYLAQFPAIYWNIHDQPAAQQQNQDRLFNDLYRQHRYWPPHIPPQAELQNQGLQFPSVPGREQNPDPALPGKDAHIPHLQAADNNPPHLAYGQFEAQREEETAALAAGLQPKGVPLHRALTLPYQAPRRAWDDWRTHAQALEQQNAAPVAALRAPGRALDRAQSPPGHAARTISPATAALQALHDKRAPAPTAPRPRGSAFDLTRGRQSRNTPKAAALEDEARLHNADGNSVPSGRIVSLSPLTQAMEDMRQTQSPYSMEARLSLATALHPYIEEIEKQVGNHIQAAWVGPMPPHLVASTRDLIRREVRKGIPRLVESELEDIDRVVRKIHWEKLYSAQGLDQLQHHGEIAAPETVDEYVALHTIVRSRDRRAPPHHEELARQAHVGVMKSMGKQQPPPRVALFHHYGHPDRQPPQGQRGTAQRIQKYLERKAARSLRQQAQDKTPHAATAGTEAGTTNRTAGGKPAQPPAPPGLDLTNTGIRSAPQRGTLFLSLLDAARNEQGFASGPSQRIARIGVQPRTSTSRTGTGSKDTPILIDDADSDDESRCNTLLPTEDVLLYRGAGARAKGPMVWGEGEPPKNRERV